MKKLALLVALALVSIAPSALADETVAPKPVAASAQKTIVLHDYVVYGRNARPMAVTEVTRLPVASTLSVLRQPLVQRVEPTVHAAPF